MLYSEKFPGGAAHMIQSFDDTLEQENMPEVVVPPNAFFVVGDNRDDSEDSRFSYFGFVPARDIVGPARIIIWARNKSRLLKSID